MGSFLAQCCDRKSCNILFIGSEKAIKHKILQRNFEDFIKEEQGQEEFEELNIQIDQHIHFKLLDITPDRLEERFEKYIHKFNGIIFLTTPSYEEFDNSWIESLRENNIYSSKYILFFVDPDSNLQLSEEGFPKQKVIITKYDNDDLTEKGINWITQSILNLLPINPHTTAIQMS